VRRSGTSRIVIALAQIILAHVVLGAVALVSAGPAVAQTVGELSSPTRDKLRALGFPRLVNSDPGLTMVQRDRSAVSGWRASVDSAIKDGPLKPAEIAAIEAQPLPTVFGAVIGRPSVTSYARVANYPSRATAEAAGRAECLRNGGGEGCERGFVVADKWCVGYSTVPDANGRTGVIALASFDRDPAVALRKSLDECRKRNDKELHNVCNPVVTLCADGRE
jgi:hypothetical protein